MLRNITHASKTLPTRMRRILFIFSVFGSLDTKYGQDNKTIVDINVKLHLSNTDKVCRSAASLGSRIWPKLSSRRVGDKSLLNVATNPVERELVISYFIRRCPRWLRYGDPNMDDMRRDLRRLFNVIVTKDAD